MGRRLCLGDVIERFHAIHGNKYDYTLFDLYTRNTNKIQIICKDHGIFTMQVLSHLDGQGCPRCGIERRKYIRRSSTEGFIEKSIERHGCKYDYSQVEYIDSKVKVQIECYKHGSFFQLPWNHAGGQNCPGCAVETRHGFSRDRLIRYCEFKNAKPSLYLVCMEGNNEKFLKIGITATSTSYRFRGVPYIYEEILIKAGEPGFIWDLENEIHSNLAKFKYSPLLYFKGHTECYHLNSLQEIINLWKNIQS